MLVVLLVFSFLCRSSIVTPGGTANGRRPILDCFAAVKENDLYDRSRCRVRLVVCLFAVRKVVFIRDRKHNADVAVLEDVKAISQKDIFSFDFTFTAKVNGAVVRDGQKSTTQFSKPKLAISGMVSILQRYQTFQRPASE